MSKHPRSYVLSAFILGLLTLAIPSANLQAQEKDPEFLMRLQPSDILEPFNVVNLRPNTLTMQGIYLRKSTKDELNDASVELIQGSEVLAKAKIVDPGKLETRLAFTSIAKEPDKMLELQGPPYNLQIRVSAGKRLYKSDLNVHIRDPRSFVDVSLAQFDPDNSKLRFRLRMKNAFVGPRECPVQLVLGPEFAESAKGVLRTVLTEPNQDVELFASNLKFKGNAVEGRVSLTVDGYERAFTYITNLKDAPVMLNIDKKGGVLVRAPRYSLPTEKLKVKLELDGPLDFVHQLEIGLDRAGTKEQFQRKTYTGLRRQKVELGFKSGDLVWKTNVQDWEEEINVAGVVNPVWFKVRVLNKENEESVLVPFAGAKPYQTFMEQDGREIQPRTLYARVILDDTPPDNVHFVKLPESPIRGDFLWVRAAANERNPDLQAPITQVTFFEGKAPADGNIKDGILGEGLLDPETGLWKAKIAIPDKDYMDLSVQFKTLTGLHESKTVRLRLSKENIPVAKIAKITGTVLRGDRPQLDLPVGLQDAKGVVKAVVKTDPKTGVYVFENVEPGTYVVYSGTTFPKTYGTTPVTVPPGKELVDNVVVNLKAK